jgi:putative aldouronate transport system permease protein
MYNPITYETADVISTYVYRKGILGGQYGFSSAVGQFNSVISLILLLLANYMNKKLGAETLY